MKINKWVLDKIGNSLVLRSQMLEMKLKFFDHVRPRNSFFWVVANFCYQFENQVAKLILW